MAPWRSTFIVLLSGLCLLGLPNRVKPDAPETPTSTKECKLLIEKALEQYSDKKKAGTTKVVLDQTISPPNDDGDDDDEEEEATSDDDEEEEEEDEGGDKYDCNGVNDVDKDNTLEEDKTEILNEETDNEDVNKNKEHNGNMYRSTIYQKFRKNDKDEKDDEDEKEDERKKYRFNKEAYKLASYYSIKAAEKNLQEEDKSNDDDFITDKEVVKEGKAEDDGLLENGETSHKTPTNSFGDDKSESHQMKNANYESDEDYDDDKEIHKIDSQETKNNEVEEDEDENEEEHDEELDDDEFIKDAEEDDDDDDDDNDDDDYDDHDEKIKIDEQETGSNKVTGETFSAKNEGVSKFSQEKPSLEQPGTPTTKDTQTEQTGTSGGDPKSEAEDDEDDESIENIYEDEEELSATSVTFRNRDHVDIILGLDTIGTDVEKEEEKLAQSIFQEIKKIEFNSIKPMEMLYKYTDSTTRILGDAEIFNKPMLLFLGPWNAGKTTIINYLLGIERTPEALKTGTGITDVDFTLVTYGERRQVVTGTELAADWKYAGLQKFGQGFLDHFRSISTKSTLLKKVTLVDTPGILENRKNTERGYALNDVFQWFIDRADAIYVVLDPTKVDIGGEVGSVLDQLKGLDIRFLLNKADTIRRSDLMRVVGQLFWNLSPLMSSTEAPVIYAVSLSTKPFHPSAPSRFLADQEKNFLYDIKETLDRRVENRILYARRHAVRVRNHAKMCDCYLATYYRHKSIFSNRKMVAKEITENPREYSIFDGLSSMTNVSRYDLPDPNTYKDFFKLHPLYDFKPLASTCSYFRGCPMEKLDAAIAHQIPELFAKYKKAKSTSDAAKQQVS